MAAPRTEWVHCPICGATYQPPLEVLSARMLRSLAMAGFVSGFVIWVTFVLSFTMPYLSSVALAALGAFGFNFAFILFFMIPVLLFRAGMNRRRRSRLR